MRSSSQPHGPSGFAAFLRIAERGATFTAAGGRACISVPAQSLQGYHTLPLRSRAFRERFFAQCFAEYNTIATTHAFSAILHHLEAQAARDPLRCHIGVPTRVESWGTPASPEKIFLDLANPEGQFVEITPQGWTVTSGEHIPFETSSSTRALPAPEQPDHPSSDSPLDTLRSTLNLGAPDSPDWRRCLAWLLAALRTHGPYPILILRGPSGSGKSVAARILRTLIDPSDAPFTPLPSSARELLTLARLNWVLAFDHVSTLTPQIADTLCRLSSGVGIAHRETGGHEPLQLFIKRPILLTVTDRWTPPPDLAARALTVTLPPLTDATRRPDPEISHTIMEALPRILGALCSAVSHALASPPQHTSSPTRHAAALAWAQAAAPALNCTPLDMLEAFDTRPESDPFVGAVRGLLAAEPRWTGPAAELLKLVPLCKNPRTLSQQLRESILPLADAGIDVQFRRRPGGAKVIDLFATQNSAPSPQPEAVEELTPVPEIPSPPGLCDTTPPKPMGQLALVGQLGKLRAGCVPAPPEEPATLPINLEPHPPGPPPANPARSPRRPASVSRSHAPASDTINSTPLIDTVPDILARIVAKKREDLAGSVQPLEAWEREAELRLPTRRDFRAALAAAAPAIIAEIKKASPSKGILSQDFDPPRIARAYESGGAAALSVLTDETFFQGSLADLLAARAAVSLPVLRKDFTIDPSQILEAAAHGADAILLIAAILSAHQIRDFRELAARYRMSALVEVHNRRELDAAIEAGADLIGVNNRNLSTFEVTLDTSLALAEHMPPGALLVSESGIHNAADIVRLRAAGYQAFLVGEHLMKSGDPAVALRNLVAA
jgi:indole-3-glycerol phosphate synthase